MRRESGNMVLEAAIFLPVMFILLVGMLRIGEITYLYYQIKKALYATAEYVAAQQGVDFCADTTGQIAAAKNFGLTGTSDGSAAYAVGVPEHTATAATMTLAF